ncbi:hypothetical protein NM688_g2909 [Phlebia brevispora]|uniref:Uncharacterized protein n=1 Tax=Phlebia brevispora TaxID=194682 RepID=A0ACC1T7D7_9APHY|nr:hypothetical protein NM688_g2909 [Phlebia brevispora]
MAICRVVLRWAELILSDVTVDGRALSRHPDVYDGPCDPSSSAINSSAFISVSPSPLEARVVYTMVTFTSVKTTSFTLLPNGRYSWLPDVLRLKGSIVPRISGPVLTVTIFATAAASIAIHRRWPDSRVQEWVSYKPHSLSRVTAELRAPRRTSYDRYYEGRKDFATMISQVRIPAQYYRRISDCHPDPQSVPPCLGERRSAPSR